MILWRLLCLSLTLLVAPSTVLANQRLPVEGVVTSLVGWRVDPFGSGKSIYHKGIDIAVPVGTPVRAMRTGRVVHAGLHGGHGFTVIIEHENGDRSLFGHNSSVLVKRGEQIPEGAVIALSGNSGRSTGPHVHYEILPHGRPIVAKARIEHTEDAQISPDSGLRRLQEEKMNDVVTSILQRLNGS